MTSKGKTSVNFAKIELPVSPNTEYYYQKWIRDELIEKSKESIEFQKEADLLQFNRFQFCEKQDFVNIKDSNFQEMIQRLQWRNEEKANILYRLMTNEYKK